jgi:hypothetical protein
MATTIILKQGTGSPQRDDLEQGELAIDHKDLTLYALSSIGVEPEKVGLKDFLTLDGSNKMSSDIDINNHQIENLKAPTDPNHAVTKAYVDDQTIWDRISSSGFTCEANKRYIVDITSNSPQVTLPTVTTADTGVFVTLVDGNGYWGETYKGLKVNIPSGGLQGDASITSLVLDISNVGITFIWDERTWLVYTSQQQLAVNGFSSPWTQTSIGLSYDGRVDTGELHTHDLEAEYLLGTPRRHYEAVFARAVPLDEELNSLEKRSVKHGVEIERIEREIIETRADLVNNPVVREAVFDDQLKVRKNGEWVDLEIPETEVDLVGYATEEYVQEEISKIDIPEVNLEGYATEEYVQEEISKIDIPEGGGSSNNHYDAANMEWWPTPLLEHEGTVSMLFNIADTGRPNVDMNLPDFALAQILDINVSFFKGNNPNTGSQYDPKVVLTQLDIFGNAVKTDMLVMNEEFGWGQGFERDEEQFQIQVVRGIGKVRIDIQNVDGNAQPTKVNWQGRDVFNKIQINGLFITRDKEYEESKA